MALKKSLPLPSGVSPEYIRIDSIFYDRAKRIVQIQPAAYLDAEHAHAGAVPVAPIAPLTLEGEAAEILIEILHEACAPMAYESLKATDQFADAENA